MEKIKLFCFPHAGGSAVGYSKWKNGLNQFIELRQIELAGRGSRFSSQLYNNFDEAVLDVFNIIKGELNNSRYAFFGHSMGSMIVYELISMINESNLPEPIHSFFSGRYPPDFKMNRMIHTMPDKEFLEEIKKLGGLSKEFLENKQLLELFLPIIRSDYTIFEKHKFTRRERKFDFNISAFGGKTDSSVPIESLYEWKSFTNKKCDVCVFKGGHFFINESEKEVIKTINETIIREL